MSTLTWVLAGVVAFWLGATLLRVRGVLPDSVRVAGPLVTVHTQRGRALIERVAAPKRLWRAWGNFGLGVALVVMAGSLLALAATALSLLQHPPTETTPLNQPRNALVIPGVNDFLPLSVAPEILFGLAVGLVVHEGGHAVLCRVGDIDIESTGLVFLTVLPAGAFVEPDEESQRAASRGARSRMFAAGVTNNFAVTLLAAALLLGPVVGSIGVASGALVGGVLPGSPAATAGVGPGDVVVGVGNHSVASNDELREVLDATPDERVSIRLRGRDDAVTVERSVLVTGVVEGGPIGFGPNTTIVAVNGTRVSTTAALRDALATRPVATLTNDTGGTTTAPMGAYVVVADGGPLRAAGAPNGTAVVTSFGETRTITLDDLREAIGAHAPGETVPVTLYAGGERHSLDVTLGADPDDPTDPHLGVYLANPGISGMTVSDFGVETYPAGNYLGLLGGSCPQCGDYGGLPLGLRAYLVFTLPLIGVAELSSFPYNFAGFVGPVTNFFTVSGPLSVLGETGVFLLANVLFWTAWINVNLGFFNCVPTFMLDGGHILRTGLESVVSRLPVEDRRRVVSAATLAVQLLMLGSLFLLVFGAQVLG